MTDSGVQYAFVDDSSALGRLETRCRFLAQPVAFVGVMGMLVVACVTMADVLLRWLAGTGIIALNEIVSMVFAVAVAACLPYGVAAGINLRLDLLEARIVGRLATWVNAIGMLLSLVFLALLAWRLKVHADDMVRSNDLTLIFGWPKAPFIYVVAVIFAFSVLIQTIVTANAIRRVLVYRASNDKPESAFVYWIFAISVYGITALIAISGVVAPTEFQHFAEANAGVTLTLACSLLWLLLMALAPLSAVMGLIGLVSSALFIGTTPALSAMGSEISGFLTNSEVAVLPLFLMMGSFAATSGIAEDLYALAHAGLGRLPAGLAMSTIGGCAGFGALTGSTLATTAMIGRIALPEMRSRGYSPELATGVIAAGGTLGNLVPPGSGPLVLFALLTEASIGKLFVASAIPSLLAIVAYIVTTWLYAYYAPGSAPKAEKAKPGAVGGALRRCGPVGILFGLVLGGLYFGIFTDTEAAAVGAFGAFLIALLRGRLRLNGFMQVMGETTETTALIYPLIFSALIFSFFTGVSGVTEAATSYIANLHWPPLALVSLLLFLFVLFGTFMDSYTIMIVTVPIVTGLITGVGYDIVWWGVLNLFVVEIGGISPPFGLTMYVLKDMADVPIMVVFRGVMPFFFAGVAVLAVLTLFPVITLWLPSTMH